MYADNIDKHTNADELSWDYNNMHDKFKQKSSLDKIKIARDIYPSQKPNTDSQLLNDLTNEWLTTNSKESDVENNNIKTGIWSRSSDKNSANNIFDERYLKTWCCLGKKPNINIKYYDINNKLSSKALSNKHSCIIDNKDWYDDNKTVKSYKPHCELFMNHSMLLDSVHNFGETDNKYGAPDYLNTYGSCMNNEPLRKMFEKTKLPVQAKQVISANRQCTLDECAAKGYRRKHQREVNCMVQICSNESTLKNIKSKTMTTAVKQINKCKQSYKQNDNTPFNPDVDQGPDTLDSTKKVIPPVKPNIIKTKSNDIMETWNMSSNKIKLILVVTLVLLIIVILVV